MLCFSSSSFRSAAIVAVSAACIGTATAQNEQAALTCSQFEELFPEAIHYKENRYYAFKIDGSAVICFYNEKSQIAIALVLSRASKNIAKLAKVLRMTYNPINTSAGTHKRTAILLNPSVVPKLKSHYISTDPYLIPGSTIDLIAALLQLGNRGDFQCQFVNWTQNGLTFTFNSKRYGESNIVFVPEENEVERIYIDPRKNNEAAYYLVQRFARDVLNINSFSYLNDSRAEKLAHSYDVENVYSADDLRSVFMVKVKRGLYAVGKPTTNGNFKPAKSRPGNIPKKESAWPESITSAPQEKEDSKPTPTPAPPAEKKQQSSSSTPSSAAPASRPTPQNTAAESSTIPPENRKIELPDTPAQAMKKYLEQLQHLAK